MSRYALRCGAVLLAGLAVACGAENANPGTDAQPNDGPPNDGYNPCRVEVSFPSVKISLESIVGHEMIVSKYVNSIPHLCVFARETKFF